MLFAGCYKSTLTRNRDSGPRKGIAKEVGVRAGVAGITTPEAGYRQLRFEIE